MDNGKYNLWKPEYAVDISEIDTQHKKFFSYCASLIQLADETPATRHTNGDLVHLFFNYVHTHFATSWMKKNLC